MTATEFNDASHYGFFFAGETLRNGNGWRVRQSALVLAALRSAGLLDNMVDGTVPPATDKLWLDKNTDPPVLKEWNPVGAAWEQVTSQTLFGRVPWQGEWQSSWIYRRADVVSYQGRIWIAVQPSQNHPPAEDAYWDLFLDNLADNSVTRDKLSASVLATLPTVAADTMLVDNAAGNARETKTFAQVLNLLGMFATRAEASAATVNASLHAITLRGNATEGDGDGGPFIDSNNGSPDTFTSNGGTRTWYRVADIGFGRINIGAQPGPKGIEYFNTSLTRCSSGNYSVDFNALQAGLNSEYAVDIAGQKLQIEDTVIITKQESMLMSSIPHQRNGSGDQKRSGNIQVMDSALAVLFDVQTYNTRFEGIRVKCDSANTTTRHFNFTRPTNVNDVDTSIKRCVFEYGLSVLRTYGRGLQFNECEVVGTSDMAIELEWNPDWVSNGQSNDQNGTAQRAYIITQIRQHGCKGLVKNVGTFKKQISDILISDVQGDTGGVIFEGVLKHSLIDNIHSWIHPVSADQIVLHGGSQYSTINNFNCGGFYQASPLVDRTPNRFFNIQPTDADSILGIVFSNGVTGPTNTSSRITGGGKCDVTFDNVQFVDVGMIDSPNEWIFVAASGGTIVDFQLRLKNCRFRAAQDASPPATIVGGNQNALIKVYKDFMTTQDGVSAAWTAPTMTLITS